MTKCNKCCKVILDNELTFGSFITEKQSKDYWEFSDSPLIRSWNGLIRINLCSKCHYQEVTEINNLTELVQEMKKRRNELKLDLTNTTKVRLKVKLEAKIKEIEYWLSLLVSNVKTS